MVQAPSRPSRTDALADALTAANQQVALAKFSELARAFGLPPPQDITDERVLAAIEERAQTSAASIVSTQATVAARLIDAHGSGAAAQMAYDDWARSQAQMVADYESRMTSSMAVQDFVANNDQLRGQEWVEPTDSVGEDECASAISLGRQPLGTIDPPPYHPRCPHALVMAYERVADPGSLWLGQSDE